MSAIRVVIADDHALVRAGIRSLLEELHDVAVVGEASEGHEALELIEQLRPDVTLMDIAMPGMNGIEVTAHLRDRGASTRTIILSMHATEEYVRRALRAGAAGYLLKDAAVAELEMAVRAVARHETYLTPAVSRHVVERYVSPDPAGDATELDRLTPRHREILQLVAEGKTTKEIAARLELGVRTIEAHRAEIMRRLDIHDVAGLVRFAIRAGLISPDR
jgi:DNA-binding NarL/FixJ family response regulator